MDGSDVWCRDEAEAVIPGEVVQGLIGNAGPLPRPVRTLGNNFLQLVLGGSQLIFIFFVLLSKEMFPSPFLLFRVSGRFSFGDRRLPRRIGIPGHATQQTQTRTPSRYSRRNEVNNDDRQAGKQREN